MYQEPTKGAMLGGAVVVACGGAVVRAGAEVVVTALGLVVGVACRKVLVEDVSAWFELPPFRMKVIATAPRTTMPTMAMMVTC